MTLIKIDRLSCAVFGLAYLAFALFTAMIGCEYNKSIGSNWPHVFALCDFFLAPLVWIKWMLWQQVNLSLIQQAFAWFLK